MTGAHPTAVLIMLLLFYSCRNTAPTYPPAWEDPITGIRFVLIRPGSFLMGDSESPGQNSGSEVLHKVTITKRFGLAQTEVTRQQWEKIMGKKELHPDKPSPFRNTDRQYPIVSVSYDDIQQFLEKLNRRSSEYHFRLPTEAEWEYACRAGTTTIFSCGPVLSDTLANYKADIPSEYSTIGKYVGHPQPVGSYPPNAWGLYDMHGNVWEWVSDWSAPYSDAPVTDPVGPQYGEEKVIRGGSWYFGAENAKAAARRTHRPDLWGFSIGFRIVCEKKS